MTKYKTDSLISIIAARQDRRGDIHQSTPEVLLKAINKIQLPMNISKDYNEGTSVGIVTDLFPSQFKGLFSIGAIVDLKEEFNYVSVAYKINKYSIEAHGVMVLEDIDIVSFSAFNCSGYLDVAKVYKVE